jgi:hypothetical protein
MLTNVAANVVVFGAKLLYAKQLVPFWHSTASSPGWRVNGVDHTQRKDAAKIP